MAGVQTCSLPSSTDLVGELPRSNGQTTAWPSRARVRVTKESKGGAWKSLNLNSETAPPATCSHCTAQAARSGRDRKSPRLQSTHLCPPHALLCPQKKRDPAS